MQKKAFKVITHVEKPNSKGYWMRLGTAYPNKDESINVYLDAMPVGQKDIVLQLREMDEEDFKKKDYALSPRVAPSLASETSTAATPF